MAKVVVDESGEIVNYINPGDRILRGTSLDAIKQFEVIPAGEQFIKMYRQIVPELLRCELSAAELIVFMHLAVNLRYRSNVAKYQNGRLIDRQDLMKDLKMSESTVKRTVRRLIDKGLMVEANTIEGRVFVLNPYVCMVGDKINKTVFDLFRKSKWARW